MSGDTDVDTVVVERVVKAPAETVFTFFTDPVQWYASGRVVELDSPRRIMFSWGWEMDGNPMPPGSTLVEVDLLPDPAGTLVRLIRRNLPRGTAAMHDEGWNHYLDRLTVTASGGDAGPDPWLAV